MQDRHRKIGTCVMIVACLTSFVLSTPAKNPNVLVIRGDDIGNRNINRNNRGMLGHETSNVDRIAAEGVFFTD